ncbi:hypothetical protein [Vibrio celticus]|uniref:Uncharacterized protein n=1 Tax=Vibrio celticus TaxID=446372 RepID=A0A1C3JIP7_9VIBR|nr:hypothetical protein [Vibrio celticus]SBT15083.1 hypothetical protein VCE7224_03866 [Vibrio celticus]
MEHFAEATIEKNTTHLLTQMENRLRKQKHELVSGGWDKKFMIEQEGSVEGFFEQCVFGDDVCKEVFAEFIKVNKLDDFDIVDTSFIDDVRDLQHTLIGELVEEYA